MKIPRTIKIGGKKIKVRIVDEGVLSDTSAAEWDGNRYIISIVNAPDASPDRMNEAFLHEIVEAINQFYELNLPHWKLNIVGELLYQILKDNKLDFK